MSGKSQVFPTVRVQFDEFMLDSGTRQLLRGGEETRLEPKSFDLLCLLVERRPAVVDRPTLIEAIWGHISVSRGSLDNLVAIIRRALSDNAKQPRYIKTHYGGRGFSFCGRAEASAVPGVSDAPPFQLVSNERTFTLVEGENIIGRDHRYCNVCLNEATVSRRHARIRFHRATGEAVIEDLGSTHKTLVGGTEVTAPRRLAKDDVIQMGDATLRFQSVEDGTRKLRRQDGAKAPRSG
jgi:DNA-binding winged helix-turn-helix (wHTH) protein